MEYITVGIICMWAIVGCPITKQDWKESYNFITNKQENV